MKKGVLLGSFLLVMALGAAAQGAGLAFRCDLDVERALARQMMSGQVPVTNSFVFSGNELAETVGYRGRIVGSPGFKSRLIFSVSPSVTGASGINAYESHASSSADPTLLYFIDGVPLFAEVGADFRSGDRLAGKVKMDLTMRQDWVGENQTKLVAPWDFNSIFRTILSDWRFPQEGWISLAGDHAWIAAGRFKSGIGDGHFGNTFFNTRAEWYDQAQGAVGNENFRFMSVIGTSASHLNSVESAIQYRTYPDGTRFFWDSECDHDSVPGMEAAKAFAYHQVEMRFWDRLRIGVAEFNIIGGKNPSILDVLPIAFWHNTYTAGFTNVMMSLNAAAVPVKGLKLFGEFTLDDIKAPDDTPESKPLQCAWQAGAQYAFEPMDKLIVTAGGEYTYTSDWVYCRWQPYLTMYQRHLLPGGYVGTDWPFGFAYGPDAKHLGFFVNASLPEGGRVELSYEYLIKGPIYMGMTDGNGNPIYYDYDSWSEDPADPARHYFEKPKTTTLAEVMAKPDQHSHKIGLSAAWPLPMGFEANGSIEYWMHSNYRNVEGDSKRFLLFNAGVLWRY